MSNLNDDEYDRCSVGGSDCDIQELNEADGADAWLTVKKKTPGPDGSTVDRKEQAKAKAPTAIRHAYHTTSNGMRLLGKPYKIHRLGNGSVIKPADADKVPGKRVHFPKPPITEGVPLKKAPLLRDLCEKPQRYQDEDGVLHLAPRKSTHGCLHHRFLVICIEGSDTKCDGCDRFLNGHVFICECYVSAPPRTVARDCREWFCRPCANFFLRQSPAPTA